MSAEHRVDLAGAIRVLSQRLSEDDELVERLRTAPRAVLQEFDSDAAFPSWSGFRSLGDLLESFAADLKAQESDGQETG